MDELINELLTPALKSVWLTCSLCGAKIKTRKCQDTWPRFIRERLENEAES